MDKNKNFKKIEYTKLLSKLGEINRPPGGKIALKKMIDYIGLTKNLKVLDIGCNTGFCTLEIARIKKSKIYGIDICPNMITKAKLLLRNETKNIQKLVKYKLADAKKIPFKDEEFDHIISGGSTAFIDDIPKALIEYKRVLKTWGFFGDINFYYNKRPPKNIIKSMNDLMKTNISFKKIEDWIRLYEQEGFEVFEVISGRVNLVNKKQIKKYVDKLIADINKKDKILIKKNLIDIMQLFNENNKYLSYAIFILRKRYKKEEPYLFNP